MKKSDALTKKSPGFNRMNSRLGANAAEKLRLDTVKLQQEAIADIRKPTAGPADKARDQAAPMKSGAYPPTKKMEHIFKKQAFDPASIKTLDDLVQYWTRTFGAKGSERHQRDEVVGFCAQAKTIEEAIQRACRAKRPNGKLHNHQSRVPEKIRMFYAKKITNKFDTVTINDFDELHDWLEGIAPDGIGPVTIYDVATRIGGFLKMEPQSLYLHAGVRIGWNLLHGRRYLNVKRVRREDWPKALRCLPADEVEDCLCALKDYLSPDLLKSQG
jgi:hypothetical protein